MREPKFWRRPKSISGFALRPLSWLYQSASFLRRVTAKPQKAALPIICVGNVTVGGAGKTPVTDFIAQHLKDKGWSPAILSRGYGGQIKDACAVDLNLHNSIDVGDEPLMLAQRHQVFIGADRAASAELARNADNTILIKDDGLQNPSLYHDINILVVDGEKGFGNELIFPAGPLREHPYEALNRTDIVIIIGDATGHGITTFIGKCHGRAVPVFYANTKPSLTQTDDKKPVLAYCAIARPQKFYQTLANFGFEVAQTRDFPDHYYFSEDDAKDLLRFADAQNLTLYTTEKDAARLTKLGDEAHYRQKLLERSTIVPIRLEVSDDFMAHILARLKTPSV